MTHSQACIDKRHRATLISRAVVVIFAISVISGCSESSRCIGGKVPQFDTAVLAKPVLNQVYSQVIRASVKNSVEDDLYRYSFSLAGDLPSGLSTLQDDRRFIFEGTPTVLGVFPVELTVTLSNENNLFDSADVNELCRTSSTVPYELNVSTL